MFCFRMQSKSECKVMLMQSKSYKSVKTLTASKKSVNIF